MPKWKVLPESVFKTEKDSACNEIMEFIRFRVDRQNKAYIFNNESYYHHKTEFKNREYVNDDEFKKYLMKNFFIYNLTKDLPTDNDHYIVYYNLKPVNFGFVEPSIVIMNGERIYKNIVYMKDSVVNFNKNIYNNNSKVLSGEFSIFPLKDKHVENILFENGIDGNMSFNEIYNRIVEAIIPYNDITLYIDELDNSNYIFMYILDTLRNLCKAINLKVIRIEESKSYDLDIDSFV